MRKIVLILLMFGYLNINAQEPVHSMSFSINDVFYSYYINFEYKGSIIRNIELEDVFAEKFDSTLDGIYFILTHNYYTIYLRETKTKNTKIYSSNRFNLGEEFIEDIKSIRKIRCQITN